MTDSKKIPANPRPGILACIGRSTREREGEERESCNILSASILPAWSLSSDTQTSCGVQRSTGIHALGFLLPICMPLPSPGRK